MRALDLHCLHVSGFFELVLDRASVRVADAG